MCGVIDGRSEIIMSSRLDDVTSGMNGSDVVTGGFCRGSSIGVLEAYRMLEVKGEGVGFNEEQCNRGVINAMLWLLRARLDLAVLDESFRRGRQYLISASGLGMTIHI